MYLRGPALVAEHVRIFGTTRSGLDLFLLNGRGADACAADLVAGAVLVVAGPVVRAAIVLVRAPVVRLAAGAVTAVLVPLVAPRVVVLLRLLNAVAAATPGLNRVLRVKLLIPAKEVVLGNVKLEGRVVKIGIERIDLVHGGLRLLHARGGRGGRGGDGEGAEDGSDAEGHCDLLWLKLVF